MDTERLKEITERTVQYCLKKKVDQAQVSAFLTDEALTRFANSQIHQNVAAKSGGVIIKAVLNKQISTVRVNTLEEEEIKKAVVQAVKIAKASPPNKGFTSFPKPEKWTPIKGAFDKETAECDPKYRAKKVKEAIETAHSRSKKVKAVAGFYSSESMAFAVANSLGVSAWASLSMASMKTTVISKSGASEGFAAAVKYSRRVRDIDPSVLAADAAEKSVKSLNPVKIDPGEYEVVLSPVAVAYLLMYIGFGFSAAAYQDGQSFVKYNLGKKVFDSKLSVSDDAHDSKSLLAVPVDGEGVPKKALKLIDRGVVSEKGLCYNSFTAGKENKKSTGHAPMPTGVGSWSDRPAPFNMIVKAGSATLEKAIAETKHGIFVNTVHYVNTVEPAKVVLTGLTRDGTFLIEDGELSKPIVNMRFTDSMLSAFSDVPMVGKRLEMVSATTVPFMKLEKLRFVGVSAY
ncbi:TldD/PmbA family protein [Candidatus Bathyarchaeota archaeon]|nr:TldD/PmbA family protein [Candidatus Bathyarchaeota archaeon]